MKHDGQSLAYWFILGYFVVAFIGDDWRPFFLDVWIGGNVALFVSAMTRKEQ